MDFPITDLMDEDACYAKLVAWLHPDGLACPRCRRARPPARPPPPPRPGPRLPLRPLRSGLQRLHRHGPAGHPAAARRAGPDRARHRPGRAHRPAGRELDRDRSQLLELRHRLQDAAYRDRPRMPLDDPVLEADEMYQNAGEKRRAAPRPRRPAASPGQQAARATAAGTTTGRRSAAWWGGRAATVRLTVARHSDGETLRRVVRRASWPMVTVYTDEWQGYDRLPEIGRSPLGGLPRGRGVGAGRRRGRGARGPLQHAGGAAGRGCGTSCGRSAGSTRSTCTSTWRSIEWGYIIKRVTGEFIQSLLGIRHPLSSSAGRGHTLADSRWGSTPALDPWARAPAREPCHVIRRKGDVSHGADHDLRGDLGRDARHWREPGPRRRRRSTCS